MEIKTTEYVDLIINFEQQPSGTLNQHIVFTENAFTKNPDLFKILQDKLKPNKTFIFQKSERKMTIPSLSKKVWYHHYMYQIMELIESRHLRLDIQHKRPLTHEESIGDLRSYKEIINQKKEIATLKDQLRSHTLST